MTKGGGWNKRASGRPFRKDRKPADKGRAPGPSDPEGLVRLYGTHAVEAALNSEWERLTSNPARAVRKPSGARRRSVTPLAPETVEEMRHWLLRRNRFA